MVAERSGTARELVPEVREVRVVRGVPVVRERPPGDAAWLARRPGRAWLAGSLEKSRTNVAASRL